MMNYADYFIPNADFLDSDKLNFGSIPFFDKIFRLKNLVNGKLVVTNGEHGAYYIFDQKLFHVPAPKVQVKDTIGAGDNFHAAFAYAISKEFEFSKAVRFSVAVASLSCTGYGGRNGIPSFDEAMGTAEQLEVNSVFKP